jgi:hypothetical protein
MVLPLRKAGASVVSVVPFASLKSAFCPLRQASFRHDQPHRASRSRAEQTWTYGPLHSFPERDKMASRGHLQVFLPISTICVITVIAIIYGRFTAESSWVLEYGVVGACNASS